MWPPVWVVRDSSGVGKIDGHFDLFDDRFKKLVQVVHGGHAQDFFHRGGHGGIGDGQVYGTMRVLVVSV